MPRPISSTVAAAFLLALLAGAPACTPLAIDSAAADAASDATSSAHDASADQEDVGAFSDANDSATAADAADSEAGPPSSGFMTFAGSSRQCVAVSGAIASGASLETRACDGSPSEGFAVSATGAIVSMADQSLCIDPSRATLAQCTNAADQAWTFTDGALTPAGQSTRCLDIQYGEPFDNTPVDIASCNGSRAQVFWPFGIPLVIPSGVHASDASGPAGLTGKGVGPAGPGTLDVEACTMGTDQRFTSTVTNAIVIDGACADVILSKLDAGLQLWVCNNAAGQQWAHAQLAGGLAFVSGIFEGAESTCLTAPGGAAGAGTVDLEPCKNDLTQTWHVAFAPP
jgi:hypothetical protein